MEEVIKERLDKLENELRYWKTFQNESKKDPNFLNTDRIHSLKSPEFLKKEIKFKEIKFKQELEYKIRRGIIGTWKSLDEIFPEGFLDNLSIDEVKEYDNFVREKFESVHDQLSVGLTLNEHLENMWST